MILDYADVGQEMSVVWVTPSHLQVMLHRHEEIELETVIFSTIAITVNNPNVGARLRNQ